MRNHQSRLIAVCAVSLGFLGSAIDSCAEEITSVVYLPNGSIVVNGKPVQKYPSHEEIFRYWTRPAYPIEARPGHHQGVGIYRMTINSKGEVVSVSIRQSARWPELDSAAVGTLRRWRAKPGPKREIDTRIEYVLK